MKNTCEEVQCWYMQFNSKMNSVSILPRSSNQLLTGHLSMAAFRVSNSNCTVGAFEKIVGNSPGFFEIDKIVLFLVLFDLLFLKLVLNIRYQH